MSLIGIIILSFLIALIVFSIGAVIIIAVDPYHDVLAWVLVAVLAVVVWIGWIFIGIGLTTNEAKVFVASYEVEKMTIEQSIDSDILTGLERIELVKRASELNGELAARKEKSTFWHWVYFEKGIYDNVEFIDLGGSVNESN